MVEDKNVEYDRRINDFSEPFCSFRPPNLQSIGVNRRVFD